MSSVRRRSNAARSGRSSSPSLDYRERVTAPRSTAPNSPSLLGPYEPPPKYDSVDVPILPDESPGGPVPMQTSLRLVPPAPLPPAADTGSSGCIEGLEGVEGVEATPPEGTRFVQIKDRVVAFKRAPCKRASRAARPSEPSTQARDVCRQLIQAREGELKGQGRTRVSADDHVRYRSGAPSGGKGPAIRAQQPEEQSRMNHIAQLKAKNVETHNNEASFLLWGNTAEMVRAHILHNPERVPRPQLTSSISVCEQCYDRLAESALRSNAVNSSVTKRKETQGAAYQSK